MTTPATTTVLVVSDNVADSYLTQLAVKECGQAIQPRVVSNGVEALRFLRKDVAFAYAPTPALIILDLHLPKLSATEILPAIRQLPAHHATPIVVLSDTPKEREEEHCLHLGASEYMQKPLDGSVYLDSVKASVRHWLKAADTQWSGPECSIAEF